MFESHGIWFTARQPLFCLQSVQAVDAAIPLSQAGQHEMNLILGAAGTAREIGQVGEQISKTNTVAAVQTIANLAVASLNAAGVFKHATPVSSS